MRLCFDLDGVICELRKEGQHYSELAPVPGAIQTLKRLKNEGHEIIIHTARHMKTTEGSVGKVVARLGKVTLDWLDRHEVPFDEIFFGKPYADFYIDDNALRFVSWTSLIDQLKSTADALGAQTAERPL